MLSKDFEHFTVLATLIYTATALLHLAYMYRSPLITIPIPPMILFYVFKNLRSYTPPLVLATSVFLTLISSEGFYLSIPLILAAPFLMRRAPTDADLGRFLGPTTTATVKYSLLLTPLLLIELRTSAAIFTILTAALTTSLISYIKLSKAYVGSVSSSEEVVFGGKALVALDIYTPLRCYVIVVWSGGRYVHLVSGRATVYVDIPALHVGRNSVGITISAFDVWGFAGRTLERITVDYRVVPMTYRIAEVAGRTLLEYSDVEKSLSEIEVAIANLELGAVATPGRGEDVVKLIHEYIRRARLYPHVLGIAERFIAVLEELIHESRSEAFRRSRYGEYMGVRNYAPGDHPRHIHWKKSLSKGDVIVKEFSVEVLERMQSVGVRGLEPIVIADLYAANSFELDRITFTLIKLCLDVFRRSPTLRLSIILVIGGVAIVLRGRAADILYRLYHSFRENTIQTLFNYTPTIIDETQIFKLLEVGEVPRPISIYVASNTGYADTLLKLIISEGLIPPRPFTAIHSSSLTFRYAVVRSTLDRNGYTYIPPQHITELLHKTRLENHEHHR